MAEQTFTSGQILTAAQMTTLQTNIGLAFISSTTVGTGVSSVSVAGCFTSTYDNYRIILSNIDASSTDNVLTMSLNNSAGSTYIYVSSRLNYTTGAQGGNNSAGTTSWMLGLTSTSDNMDYVIDVISPNLVKRTAFNVLGSSDSNYIYGGGQDTNAATQTGFSINTSGGVTMTGGTINVYGYRKS